MCSGCYRSGFQIVKATANRNFKVLILVLDVVKLTLTEVLFSVILSVNLVRCKLLFTSEMHR